MPRGQSGGRGSAQHWWGVPDLPPCWEKGNTATIQQLQWYHLSWGGHTEWGTNQGMGCQGRGWVSTGGWAGPGLLSSPCTSFCKA